MKFIPNVVSIVDQVLQQGHDFVQISTHREFTELNLRIRNLQEQNEALRNQVSDFTREQQTPIVNEPQMTRGVTFTPITVNTFAANYLATELFQQIPTGASVQPMGSSPSTSVGLVPSSGVAVPHSVVNAT